MNKTIIVALFGEAGAGKDTIQKEIVKQSPELFSEIISSTTRPPRDYEKDGVDYYFIDNKTSEKYIQEHTYLEYAEFNGWRYGTFKGSLTTDRINVGVFNIAGIKQLLKLDPSEYIIIPVEILCNDKKRLQRQLNREESPNCAEICRRFLADKEDFRQKNIDFWHMWIFNETDELSAITQHLIDCIYKTLVERVYLNHSGRII